MLPYTEEHNLFIPMIKKMNILVGLVKTTNALLANVLQGGMSDMGMKAFREKEQEQELTDSALSHFKMQLHIRVTPIHDPQLGNWVKNMKT